MRPDARVAAAIEVLDIVLGGTPAEVALTRWSRGARYAGSKDRAAVRDLVFDALRCKRSAAALGGAMTGRGLMIGLLSGQGVDLETLFTGAAYAPLELSAGEREHLSAPPDLDAGAGMDIPDWLLDPLRDALGANLEAVCAIMRERAPVFLRTNAARTSRDAVINALLGAGIQASPHELSPHAIAISGNPRGLRNAPGFLAGDFEFQDAASQAVVDMLEIEPGTRLLDYCAGGGGKALAAAALGAEVTAHDAIPDRMQDLPDRARRAGSRIALVDGDDLPNLPPFDIVLCDVPCSGSGAWRRQPEARWTLTAEALSDLNVLQGDILARAASLVAPEGRLAYATCSLLGSENEAIISAFLKAHPEWTPIHSRRISPLEGGDGFFCSVLTRA